MSIYNIFPKAVGAYNLYFDVLDGDLKKVEIIDKTIDIGVNPPMRAMTFRCGRRVYTEFLPKRVRPKKKKGKLPDYCGFSLTQICSQRFKDIVETLEPAVHQFEPVLIVWGDGTEDERPYYWFVPCVRVHSLDPETTYPPLNKWGSVCVAKEDGASYPRPFRYVFRSSILKDHQIFVEAAREGHFFCTESLKASVEAASITGVGFGEAHKLI